MESVMSLSPVWSIKLDDKQPIYVLDENCPLSVQSLCRLSVEGERIGHALDTGFPIEHLAGIDEKFKTILSNGVDPDVGGRLIYCGSCILISKTPVPFMERSSARLHE